MQEPSTSLSAKFLSQEWGPRCQLKIEPFSPKLSAATKKKKKMAKATPAKPIAVGADAAPTPTTSTTSAASGAHATACGSVPTARMTTSMPTNAAGSCSGVTQEILDAVRDEFLRLRGAWEDSNDHIEGALDCCKIPPLVIARSVTQAILEEIPDDWLKGLSVSLSAEGVLELVGVEGNEHRKAKSEIFSFLNEYKRAHDTPDNELEASEEQSNFYFGAELRPDGELSAPYPQDPVAGQMQRILPFVVVEVDVHNRTIPEIITRARLLLSEPHVHHVVAFKIYPSSGNHSKGAVAIEFERDGAFQQGVLAAIRVVGEFVGF